MVNNEINYLKRERKEKGFKPPNFGRIMLIMVKHNSSKTGKNKDRQAFYNNAGTQKEIDIPETVINKHTIRISAPADSSLYIFILYSFAPAKEVIVPIILNEQSVHRRESTCSS